MTTKMARRRTSSIDVLACRDRLLCTVGHKIIQFCDQTMPYGPPRFKSPSLAMLDYFTRKKFAIRAEYFRQRYGRDYWTGVRRHTRQRVTWWNEGYQDEVDGSIFCRKPDAWSDQRWKAYCLGQEVASRECKA